ncbi:MAG: hypothetical protein R3C68_02715 [Myxococcota bacterium]
MNLRQTVIFSVGLCALAGLMACRGSNVTLQNSFASPMGLAVAGSGRVAPSYSGDTPRCGVYGCLFVANSDEDTLQVLRLDDQLNKMAFVNAPARFTPLRIPAGPFPSELAATADGRFVVILNAITDSLSLVDADALRLARDELGPVRLRLGNTEVGAQALVASARSCEAPCSGTVYVALRDAGGVLEVDVMDTPAQEELPPGDDRIIPGRFVVRRLFETGGQPQRLAIDATGERIFATDGASEDLIEIDVSTAEVRRVSIGASGGAIAVSRDGTTVLVSRPALEDVAVIRVGALGELSVYDANAAFAPVPDCVVSCESPCDETQQVCECFGTHPATQALCGSPSGLELKETPYEAIYLGETVTHMQTFGAAVIDAQPSHPVLEVSCTLDNEATQIDTYRDYALLATQRGPMLVIGLSDEAGVFAPRLIDARRCRAAQVSEPTLVLDTEPVASGGVADLIFAPCPDAPDRQRFDCIGGTDQGRIGILPGATGERTLVVDWEGLISIRAPAVGWSKVTAASVISVLIWRTLPLSRDSKTKVVWFIVAIF